MTNSRQIIICLIQVEWFGPKASRESHLVVFRVFNTILVYVVLFPSDRILLQNSYSTSAVVYYNSRSNCLAEKQQQQQQQQQQNIETHLFSRSNCLAESESFVSLVPLLTLLVLWASWKELKEQACFMACPVGK